MILRHGFAGNARGRGVFGALRIGAVVVEIGVFGAVRILRADGAFGGEDHVALGVEAAGVEVIERKLAVRDRLVQADSQRGAGGLRVFERGKIAF